AQNRGVLAHRLPRIDLDAPAVADDHDASARGEQSEVFVEIDVRRHFEHDVDATAAGGLHDLVEVARRRVVEDGIGAALAYRLQALLAASGAENRDSVRVRDLRCGNADAAGRAVDQHRLAGFRL